MRLWLYCICRNEKRLMPYFLRHYLTFVERLTFYDDQSDDGTRELIQACPNAVLRDWPGEHGIVDDQFLDFANTTWREAIGHADWVIWVDADEFLYHPDIIGVLRRYLDQGVSLAAIQGFTMVSDHFPTTKGQIYEEIRQGFYDNCWCKPAIFRDDIRWTMGRHGIDPHVLKTKSSDHAEIKMLHYRCLGMDYLRERHTRNWARVPDRCRAMQCGINTSPGYVGHHSIEWFQEQVNRLPELPIIV